MKKQNLLILIMVLAIAMILILILLELPINKPKTKNIECLPEQRNTDACITLYEPVCANVNVQCITTPCPPVKETFSNACDACKNPLVDSYIGGEC